MADIVMAYTVMAYIVLAYIVMAQYSCGLCSNGLYTPRTRFRRAASPTRRPAFLWTNSHCDLSADLFLTTFRGMLTANAEGLGRIRRAPVGRVSARPSAPLGSSAFAVGMLRDIETKKQKCDRPERRALARTEHAAQRLQHGKDDDAVPDHLYSHGLYDMAYKVVAYIIWPTQLWPM